MRVPWVVFAMLGACDAPAIEPECGDGESGTIEGRVITDQVPGVVRTDLTVRGVASHTQGHVIRRVVVAGIAAKNDGFNFDQWSALVPIGVLTNLQDADPDAARDAVVVEVKAFDGCDHEFVLDTFEVAIDRTPAVIVENLAMTVEVPRADYLPADGSASATIRLTANADARGATVTMAANTGTFGGVAAGNLVNLAGDGSAPAESIVLFTASGAQDAIINAQAGNVSAVPHLIRVAGAATLSPASVTLRPGESVVVTVLSEIEDQVVSCQAVAAAGLTVSAFADDEFTVTAAPMLSAASTVNVVCRDHYGQAVSGSYRAEP